MSNLSICATTHFHCRDKFKIKRKLAFKLLIYNYTYIYVVNRKGSLCLILRNTESSNHIVLLIKRKQSSVHYDTKMRLRVRRKTII